MYCLRHSFRKTLGLNLFHHENISRLRFHHSIAQVYKEQEYGTRISIKGWVKALRKMKGNNFIDVSDGSSHKSMQVVIPKDMSPENLSYGCSVEVDGTLDQFEKGQVEVKADKINVIGPCVVADGYPFQPRKSYDADYVREYLHLRNRTKSFASLLRLRSYVTHHIHNYFHQHGYIHVHTPILTSNDCEGAGEVFSVIPERIPAPEHLSIEEQKKLSILTYAKEVFFDEKVWLSVSGQLHLETMARSLSKVYTMNPVFRAENSKSRLHLAEFYMLEAELAFLSDIQHVCNPIEHFVKSMVGHMLEKHGEEMEAYRKVCQVDNIKDLETIRDNPFIRMSYNAAAMVLTRNGFSVNPDSGLSKQHELFLVKYTNNIPIFIINWPKEIKPFYMKQNSTDPNQVLAVDLLCPLVGELCGGGLREDSVDILQSTLYEKKLQTKLDWYLELRKFGNVPTGGFGIGLERFIQVLCGTENIRDVIPYPRYPHHCKM
ncbi:hypothetical protein WDU94_011470 [Cyamophila willieti]